MKLLRGTQPLKALKNGAAVTIGNFDGVHKGHQALLQMLKSNAHQLGLPSLVVFFEPQPTEYFQANQAPLRLTTCREKLRWLAEYQIDYVYCLHFNEKLAQLSAEDFAKQYIFTLWNAKYLVVGEDFRFGQFRAGTPQLLQQFGVQWQCQLQIFKDFLNQGVRVSSTQIRSALQHSDLKLATKLLGHPYSMCGRVIYGEQRARLWGIPTANVWIKRLCLPLTGVYLVKVQCYFGSYWGVANLGVRPTLNRKIPSLEVHLFDFNETLYHQSIEVFFIKKLRDEKKFLNVDALVTQIHEDCRLARSLINHMPKDASFNDKIIE